MALRKPRASEDGAEGVYLTELAPAATPTSKGAWLKFWESIRSFFGSSEVVIQRDRLFHAAADGGEAKLREPAIKNAHFKAETMKLLAEMRKADAEASLAQAMADKTHAEADRIKADTEEARSKRIRDEIEFLRRHNIQATPVEENGRICGLYFESTQAARHLVEPSDPALKKKRGSRPAS